MQNAKISDKNYQLSWRQHIDRLKRSSLYKGIYSSANPEENISSRLKSRWKYHFNIRTSYGKSKDECKHLMKGLVNSFTCLVTLAHRSSSQEELCSMLQVSILIHLKMFFRILKLQLKLEYSEKWHYFSQFI